MDSLAQLGEHRRMWGRIRTVLRKRWPSRRAIAIFGMPLLALVMLSVITTSARLSVHQNEREAQKRATEYARQGHEEAQFRCAVFVPGAKRASCLHEVERTAREQQRAEYEIEADKNSAVWNEAMGEAGAIGGVIAAITLVLVFVTFEAQAAATGHARRQFLHAREDAENAAKAAEKSIKAANKTAKAAADQVSIAQETAYRDLRAYLSVRIDVSQVTNQLMSGDIVVENAGKTPAKIEVFFNSWIGSFPIDGIPADAPAPFRHFQHDPFANARSVVTAPWYYPWGKVAEAGEIDKLAKDDESFYLHGRIEFIDFAKHHRVLHFAFRKHGALNYGKPFSMIALPWGNGYEDKGKES